MSAAGFSQPGGAGGGKKAVHVKWSGKTIALGTFPAAEADEKCARAKALTRAWRSTMRPKPSREWVMVELERLGVRVVSGRLGRKAGEDGDEGDEKKSNPMPQQVERSNSIGWNNDDFSGLMPMRRNSSLGLSMMNDPLNRRGSLGSLGQVVGLDSVDPTMPAHRPLVGGGAAAAYEAARHDHFTQKEQQRRASSLGLGMSGGGLGGMGMSVNPNQHYEMLKLHHMNLLNEIQETTLMMNLYQQQQLQQQQQQLQQQQGGGGGPDMSSNPDMAMLLQQQQNGGGGQQGMDPMFGAAQMSRQSSGGMNGQLGGQFSMMSQMGGGGMGGDGGMGGIPQQMDPNARGPGGDIKAEDKDMNKRGGLDHDGEPEAKRTKMEGSKNGDDPQSQDV